VKPLQFRVGAHAGDLYVGCPDCRSVWPVKALTVENLLAVAVQHGDDQHPQPVNPDLLPVTALSVSVFHLDGSISGRTWRLNHIGAELVASMFGDPDGSQHVPTDVVDDAQREFIPRTINTRRGRKP
jgi:hypothetical protein